MKKMIEKFNHLLYPNCNGRNQKEKCCCKTELTYEEVIKRYEELSR